MLREIWQRQLREVYVAEEDEKSWEIDLGCVFRFIGSVHQTALNWLLCLLPASPLLGWNQYNQGFASLCCLPCSSCLPCSLEGASHWKTKFTLLVACVTWRMAGAIAALWSLDWLACCLQLLRRVGTEIGVEGRRASICSKETDT